MWRTLVKENRFTIVHNYTDINRAFDASYGEIIIPALEDAEYIIFMNDVNTAVNVGAIVLSIYTDASGTTFAKDSNGNDINTRSVTSTSYSYPYYDNNGIYINGLITVTFDDGSTFVNNDDNDINDENDTNGLWYYMQGVSDMNNLNKFT